MFNENARETLVITNSSMWNIESINYVPLLSEARVGLVVSALDYGASSSGLSSGRGHCVVFLGKTRHSHSASLHPGV